MQLPAKTFIITGATSGMGRGIAERFAREGASLVLSGRNEERGREVAAHIQEQGGKATFLPGDISLPETNHQLVESALENFGRLDGIVTNAGHLGLGAVTDIQPDEWHYTFAANLHAVYYLSHYSIPVMQEQGKGVIIATASIAAYKSFPNHPAYCAAKAGLVALVRQMALDYGPAIRINAICPGPVDTPLIWDSARAFPDPQKAVENAAQTTALKRLGAPQDIAALALFLASEESSWITGTAITIDGGVMATR
ncbi:MAG: SDR family oxidoreductase [Lewinellaceae bacterium]|nr:SDR family oxidoreductase [Lewinellaceae bacterium]